MSTPSQSIAKPLIVMEKTGPYEHSLRDHRNLAEVVVAEDLDALIDVLSTRMDATLLLDLSLFDDNVDHPAVGTILRKGAEHQIIVVTDEQEPANLYKLFKQGARGFCPSTISAGMLIKAITAVQAGELWLSRKLTGYLVSQLILDRGRSVRRKPVPSVAYSELTPRESEIAYHVAKGKCDKVIARDLEISPNTVKNHLSHIFDKLQIGDRYQLALIYNGVDLH